MKTTLRIVLLFMIVSGFILSGNADATKFKFKGDARITRHYLDVDTPTNEYFLVIADPTILNARIKGFKLISHEGRDFSDLMMTASTDNSGLVWWAIDLENSKAYLKAQRKAERKYRKHTRNMQKRGLEAAEKQAWIEDYIDESLEKRRIKGVFFDENGNRLKVRDLKFGNFVNSEDGIIVNPDDGNSGASPVPEPATMLLLGTGMIGLAATGRKKLFKK